MRLPSLSSSSAFKSWKDQLGRGASKVIIPRRPFSWIILSSLSKSNIGSRRAPRNGGDRGTARPGEKGVEEVEPAEGDEHEGVRGKERSKAGGVDDKSHKAGYEE